MARLTVPEVQAMKAEGRKVVMLTAYDFPSARLADEAGVDVLLVGDSLGMVVLGYENTLAVTLDDMLHHTRPVVRGAQRALVVTDLPFMTYQTSVEDAMRNAARLMQEGGCQAVKLEGGVHMAETVRRLVQVGIPVVGHIGLTPQAINQLGRYKVQGVTAGAAERLIEDAVALEQAGAFCIVLETIPARLSGMISARLKIPTIGIGAGPECDGQVLVWHEVVSYSSTYLQPHLPRHVKQYANVGADIRRAIEQYGEEVRGGAFPTDRESFRISRETLAELARSAR